MLRAEVIKKSCALVLEISDPVETLKKIALFFQDRHILIDNLQLHRYRNGNANVIIHCAVEKDQIPEMLRTIVELTGIEEVEWMEGK